MQIFHPGKTLSQFVLVLLCTCAIPLQALEEKTWKINLKNAEISELITQVSSSTGKTFIVSPRVKGKITVISSTAMNSDTIYELFLSVLRVHGYAAIPAGNVIKISQQVLAKQSGNDQDFNAKAKGEEIITRVLSIKNTPAVELVKIVRPMIPQYGHVAGLNEPNVLIVSDHAGNIARLADIIKRIDVADTSQTILIPLKEAWVADMVALLEKLAPEQIGKGAKGPRKLNIVANERTNTLILKGHPSILDKMRSLIKRLDVAGTRSGSIQVIRLAHSDAKELAEILKNVVSNSPQGQQAGKAAQSSAFSIQADEALNALVIRADPTTMLELRDIIEKLDVRRLQVLIEAAIVEVTTDFTRRLGTELAIADNTSKGLPLTLTAPAGTLASILPLTNILEAFAAGASGIALGDTPLFGAGRVNENGTSWGLIIRALASNSDIDLLSTPSITTMDNQQAKIVVGQNVPFRTGSTASGSDGATNPYTTIQREDVGLTMEVTPHVHDGNLVRLEIHQEVSEVDLSSLDSIGSSGSADLITNKRTIDTTILADDREVIILGGLIRDKTVKGNTRVPILGAIPLIGRLFKSTHNIHQKQNLLVFLRPTVLSSREDNTRETHRKYTGIWEVEIAGKDPAKSLSELFDGKKP